ncbi:MAG: ABC transporter permease [Pseudomonadota bacterium]
MLSPRPSRAWRTISALILREMTTTYGRSPGGYLWAVVEPLAVIALLSFAFSLAFKAPSLGSSFPLFYATGYLPYMVFQDVSSKTAQSFRFSRPLLSFSAVTWLDVIAARYVLNLFTQIAVGALVLGMMLVAIDTQPLPDISAVLRALGMVALLALSVGTLNAFLFLAFPAWERVWLIASRPLFIISGVFFLFEDVPSGVRSILWFNPLFHATGEMRHAFYDTYTASYVSPTFVFGVSLALLCFALLLLSRHADGLLHK